MLAITCVAAIYISYTNALPVSDVADVDKGT